MRRLDWGKEVESVVINHARQAQTLTTKVSSDRAWLLRRKVHALVNRGQV